MKASGAETRQPAGSGERLKVLYLPSWYPHPAHPTYAVFLRVQAEAISKRHDIVVVPVPQTPPVYRPGNWGDRFEVQTRPTGLRELYASGPNLAPRMPGTDERTLWRLYRKAYREASGLLGGEPDVIHGQVSARGGHFAARLAREFGRPMVLTEQCSRPEILRRTPRAREWFRNAMESADCVNCLGPIQRDFIREAGISREIEIVPNLVDTDYFAPGTPAPRPPIRVIVVGNLIDRKGVHFVIEAVARLIEEGHALELDLVGKGELRDRLEELARKEGIHDRVIFHGEKSQAEVRDLLQRAHLFVLASTTESFGVVVIEAMAVGLPVVVSRGGGPEAFVKPEHGAVVDKGAAAPLIEGIRDVVERLDHIAPSDQRQYVLDNFSEAVVVDRITERYHEAIARYADRT